VNICPIPGRAHCVRKFVVIVTPFAHIVSLVGFAPKSEECRHCPARVNFTRLNTVALVAVFMVTALL
jgi:hypothetical protein